MAIKCYETSCRFHSCNDLQDADGGPYCYEKECRWAEHLLLKSEEIIKEALSKGLVKYYTCPNCGHNFKD